MDLIQVFDLFTKMVFGEQFHGKMMFEYLNIGVFTYLLNHHILNFPAGSICSVHYSMFRMASFSSQI